MPVVSVVIGSLVLIAILAHSSMSLPVHDESSSAGSYTGFQVLEVRFKDGDNVGAQLQQMEMNYQVDVWGRPSVGVFDMMVGPSRKQDLINFLQELGATYTIKFPDVQKLLIEHVEEVNRERDRRSVNPDVPTVARRYLRFGQIKQFLQNVRDHATSADVTISSLGRTFEGRLTPYVTISEKNSRDPNKKTVIIEAGIHAREWIAPAMALNIVYRLAFNPNNEPEINELLHKFDWVIIPVMNPDGYIFSHINASTRLWRKTRTTLYTNNPQCIGVDGNRNFGYEWSDSPYQGGNSNPCTDNFSGPSGFSEPETRNLRSLLLRFRDRAALYLSMHSYGQFFLYPWGYDPYVTLEDEADMMDVAEHFADNMMQRNRYYVVGPAAKVLYTAAGASDDYARGGAGIKFAFTVELSPSDSSPHGFLLPSQHINSVVNDHWPAFKSLALEVWNKLNPNVTSAVYPRSVDNDNNINNNNGNESVPFVSEGDADDEDAHADEVDEDDSDEQEDRRSVSRRGSSGRRERAGTRGNSVSSGRSQSAITEVTIGGHIFRLDLNDRSMQEWLQYYTDFLNYRSRLSRRNMHIDNESGLSAQTR